MKNPWSFPVDSGIDIPHLLTRSCFPESHVKSMRVLITSQSLLVRAGKESFALELARHLNQHGHAVMAYGSDPGRRERLLEADLIPVTTEPAGLTARPDIIHAQNPLDALSAMAALPGTPVVYHLRQGLWSRIPPLHPGILHYLAETPVLAEDLAVRYHIDRVKISLFPNPVDLVNFPEPVRLARRLMGWEAAIEKLLEIYDQVMRTPTSSWSHPDGTSLAVSSFIESAMPELMLTYRRLGKKFPQPHEASGPDSPLVSLPVP